MLKKNKTKKTKKFAKGLVILYLLFLGPGPRSLEKTDIEHNNNRKKAIKVYQRLLLGIIVYAPYCSLCTCRLQVVYLVCGVITISISQYNLNLDLHSKFYIL